MADTHPENPGAGSGAPFDLSKFYQIFFDEAAENLDQMEHMLLHVDLSNANDESSTRSFAARIPSRAARPPLASPISPS